MSIRSGSSIHPTRRRFLWTVGTGLLASRIARSADAPYSIVVFPDEQYLAAGGPLYAELTQWVVDNLHSTALDGTDLNIVGVISVGDCANLPSATEAAGQCAVVKAAYNILDNAGIPFIAPPGNHDYDPTVPLTNRQLGPNFAAGGYLSPSVRSSFPGYGGSYDEDSGIARSAATGANWWITLQAGTRRILVMALEFFARDAVLSWARRIQDAHPDHECIVTTHGYLTNIGVQGDRTLQWGPQTYGFADGSPQFPTTPAYALSPQEMWGAAGDFAATDPFQWWPNLTAILSGHYLHSASDPRSRHYQRIPIVSSSTRAQTVHQFYCNAQELDAAGDPNGADLCLLRFFPAAGTLTTYWMSRKSSQWSPDSVAFRGSIQTLETAVPYAGLAAPPAAPPAPLITGVGNGASFAPAIAQNSWIAIVGSNLSATTRSWRADEIVNGALPQQLDGVSVTINGRSAAICYISPTQINALTPLDDSVGSVAVQVAVNGSRSQAFLAPLQPVAPGLFLWRNLYVVATHADFTPAADPAVVPGAQPAMPGEVLVLWGTGFGKSVPPPVDEHAAASTAAVGQPVVVHVGGVAVNALAADLTVGSAGLYQVSVRLPDTTPPGAATVWVEIGGVASPGGLLQVGSAS